MSREKRLIEKTDLIPIDVYTNSRKQIRKELVEFKKNRRVAIGPYATFYFESFETLLIFLMQESKIQQALMK